jgi:hypothetical protein
VFIGINVGVGVTVGASVDVVCGDFGGVEVTLGDWEDVIDGVGEGFGLGFELWIGVF